MKNIGLLILLIFFSCNTYIHKKPLPKNATTIELISEDGVHFLADFYPASKKEAPVIIFCHQATFSRGEYRKIAPIFQNKGYHGLAIDQRSGYLCNGVKNSANKSAKSLGLKTKYANALPEILSAINYVKNKFPNQKIVIWGSSYSASLALIVPQKSIVDAVVCFSPGEYFTFEEKTITNHSSKLKIPVFITSSKKEANKIAPIFKAIPSENKTHFIPRGNGKHGSKVLWQNAEDSTEYLEAVTKFLSKNS